jgi:hypothetical protein
MMHSQEVRTKIDEFFSQSKSLLATCDGIEAPRNWSIPPTYGTCTRARSVSQPSVSFVPCTSPNGLSSRPYTSAASTPDTPFTLSGQTSHAHTSPPSCWSPTYPRNQEGSNDSVYSSEHGSNSSVAPNSSRSSLEAMDNLILLSYPNPSRSLGSMETQAGWDRD